MSVDSDLESMRLQQTYETLKKDFDSFKKKMKDKMSELENQRKKDNKAFEDQRNKEKNALMSELIDMRRQMNQTQRQITKLSLIFNGPAVTDLLEHHRPNDLFHPMIKLLEKRYSVSIHDFEICDIHPLPRPRGKNGKEYGEPSIIVKFNSRHDRSAYS